ncbi:MAG: hypothetical protein DMG67_14065 [Acidobacteria bacterium]|nr:MAG: hypothetical protein DMG67_14065 [Acidobacteriota bacterium]
MWAAAFNSAAVGARAFAVSGATTSVFVDSLASMAPYGAAFRVDMVSSHATDKTQQIAITAMALLRALLRR